MERPTDLDKCRAILALRTFNLPRDTVASIVACAKETVGDVEQWFQEIPFEEAVTLCGDELIKKQARQLLKESPQISVELALEAGAVTADTILLNWRHDYLSAVLADMFTKHGNDLKKTANLFASFWEQYALSHPVGGYQGYIIDDSQFEQIDAQLAMSYLYHLKAEFSEFSGIKDWRDLLSIDLSTEAQSKLALMAKRGGFGGTCPICELW